MNSLLLIGLRIASSMPEIPEFAQEWWNTPIFGFTTIGATITAVGGFVYVLWKSKQQRKAVSSGLQSATSIETIHHNQNVEHRVRQDLEIEELRRDIITIADKSVNKEVKAIGEKYKAKLRKEQVKELIEVAKPIVQEIIKKAKKRFR